MDNEGKVSYTPSHTKRFEISHDTISRERLNAIATTVRELRKKHTFVVGSVLFGSLSKAKQLDEHMARKSDVDLIIYIDTDELKINYDAFEQDRDSERFNEWEEIDKELHEHYDPRSDDEKMLELTSQYIGDIAENMFKAKISKKSRLPKNIGFVVKPISLTGGYSIHERFRQVFRYHNLESFINSKSYNLEPLHYSSVALPWALDIGGGLTKYRRAYLAQLQQLDPQEREQEWRVTMHIIRFYERQGSIPEKIKTQYPESYAEALKYYGVKIS